MNRRDVLKAAIAVPLTVAAGALVATETISYRARMDAIQRQMMDNLLMTSNPPVLLDWQRTLNAALRDGRGAMVIKTGRQQGKHYVRQQYIKWSKVMDPTSWSV